MEVTYFSEMEVELITVMKDLVEAEVFFLQIGNGRSAIRVESDY